jgi:hypothetical protein
VNAGDAPTGDTNNSKFLRYTIVATGSSGLITVQWGGNTAAPAGTSLQVAAAPGAGYGTGSTWTFVNADATAHNLITAIPSCYTSNGGADLHAVTLTYTLNVTNAALLDTSDDKADTVIYTISAS